MKSFQIFLGAGMVVAALGLAGCATEPGTTAGSTPAKWASSDVIFQYRQEAADLREAARRLETEAAFYVQRQDEEQARQKRDLAKDMRAAADSAEQRARDYQRQLPHGQVY
jgi:hypothetical protein